MDRRPVRYALGVMFVGAGLAHFTRRRRKLVASLIPDWLAPVRSEVDVATGTLQVLGGVAMFFPSAQRFARSLNLALLVPALPAARYEARNFHRIRAADRMTMPGVATVVAEARPPAQLATAALLVWATHGSR
jgi:uncharacterized membrane protein